MDLIASHPLSETVIRPHIGKRVIGVTHWGDPFCGTIQACRDGHLHLVPIGAELSPAKVKAIKSQLARRNKKRRPAKIKSIPKVSQQQLQKANISIYGPFGFGIAPGFRFGLGAGLGFALPLLAIGALFAWPFF